MVFIFVILKMSNFRMMDLDLALVSLEVVILESLLRLSLLVELQIRSAVLRFVIHEIFLAVWFVKTHACMFCFQDGRLQNGDHIMQIDDTNVGTMTSEEVAQVLRSAGNPVRMVIARVITDNSGELPPRKPVVSGI